MEQATLHHAPDGSRWRVLARTADYEAGLVYYAAGASHETHEHDRAQLTFMLTGQFEDVSEGRTAEPRGAVHAYKPAGYRHACRFGRDGALILSVNYLRGVDPRLVPSIFMQSGAAIADSQSLVLMGLADAPDAIADMVGMLAGEVSRGRRAANERPLWLRRASEYFADDPTVTIAEVAAEVGADRSVLSRAFQRHYGLSPTRFRLHCKAARAVRLMIEEKENAAQAAVGAGFADQAHLTRTARFLAGVSPTRLRHLLAA